MNNLEDKLFEKNPKGLTQILKTCTVGIAGCGGLGSNVAVALARCGIGSLILADFDKVEYSNLNRQYYFLSDIGNYKVFALEKLLKNINPYIKIKTYNIELTPNNIKEVFNDAEVLVEAFDKASSKKWLIESWVQEFKNRLIVCGNGLSGIGNGEELKVVHFSDTVIFCGDLKTDMSLGLCAPKVAIVANMQANVVIEYLYKQHIK